MKKKIILFVCKGNRYRSRIAEEIFNKNAPKNFIAKSAGIQYQKYNDRATPKALKEIGIKMSKRKPRKLSSRALGKTSRIIIFDGVNTDTHKKVELWQIEDCHAGDINCMRGGRKRIEKMVENLVKSLQ